MDRRHFLLLLSVAAGWAGCESPTTESPKTSATAESAGESILPVQDTSGNTLLRYRFKKGEELRWNVLNTLKMKTIIGGMEENIEARSRAVKIWKTLDVHGQGAATFEYRVEDIDLHRAQTGHDDVFYNNRRDRTIPIEFSNLMGKIGVPLARIQIDPQGITTKKPLMEYDGSVSENRIVIPLPDEAVALGASWSEPKQIDLPQSNQTVKKIRVRNEFILDNIHSGLATINFATLILTPLEPKEETQLFDYFSKGMMELDLLAGHFIRQQATIDRTVVGVRGTSDSIRYLSRVTECCCGRRACETCSTDGVPD